MQPAIRITEAADPRSFCPAERMMFVRKELDRNNCRDEVLPSGGESGIADPLALSNYGLAAWPRQDGLVLTDRIAENLH